MKRYVKEKRGTIDRSNDDGKIKRTVEYPPGKEKGLRNRLDQDRVIAFIPFPPTPLQVAEILEPRRS